MNLILKCTSQSASTIVGIGNKIFFISKNVESLLADVGNWARIGNRIVDIDFILILLAQLTSIVLCRSDVPAYSADAGPYLPDAAVSAIAFRVGVCCTATTYNWCGRVG